ncbi:MAG TPA: muconolactone Delta-isomerase family protein [Bauldia sp.]|nr:muconolactone Delta-isomerase family protein [Bauldia sp.]
MTAKNRFIVRGKFIDPGGLMDAQRSADNSLTKVLPSQELLDAWEKSGRIVAGGIVAGCREIVFLVDVDTNDELSALIASLPFWGLLTWDVQALQTFAARAQQSRAVYGADAKASKAGAA